MIYAATARLACLAVSPGDDVPDSSSLRIVGGRHLPLERALGQWLRASERAGNTDRGDQNEWDGDLRSSQEEQVPVIELGRTNSDAATPQVSVTDANGGSLTFCSRRTNPHSTQFVE